MNRMKTPIGMLGLCLNMIRNTKSLLLFCLIISIFGITFFSTKQTPAAFRQSDFPYLLARDVLRTVPPARSFMEVQTIKQQSRIKNLRKTCAKHSKLTQGPIPKETLNHIYVNYKMKGLFCYVPKVACSNWKRVLMVLDGYPKPIEEITEWEAHENNRMTVLSSLPEEQQEAVLTNFSKFMVTREPFIRILSAYKDKFANSDEYDTKAHFQYYGKIIMQNYRKKPSRLDLASGRGVRWTEFADYLTDPLQRDEFDNHWQDMNSICSPCKIKYDYLAKLETLKEDAEFILRTFNVSDIVTFPLVHTSHPTGSQNQYNEYYDQLTIGTIKKLFDVYRLDYELFGYSKPNLFWS